MFLDIAWIKEKIPNAAEHIKKKLPSMYHQFKQLADIDITAGADGNRPDHALHDGRRARGRRTQMSDVPGLFAAGECARGTARRESPGRQFAVRSAGLRQARRRIRREVREGTTPRARSNHEQVDAAAQQALEPFERGAAGENPYAVQHDLQDMMQDLVGIVRREEEMEQRARRASTKLKARAEHVGVAGNREYNPGWHTALDLKNLLTVSEAITRAAHRAQGKPRRAFPRRLSRQRATTAAKFNIVVSQGRADGEMQIAPRADSADAGRAEADHRGDEVMATATFRIWRGERRAGEFQDYTTEVSEGMVVLDAVHQIQADAGQRPGRALELQGRQVRLVLGRDQRHAQADVHDAAESTCRSISRSPSSR